MKFMRGNCRPLLNRKTQLNADADCEHDGDGQKPLREPCGEMDFVHDVLLK
jgi:hypothetical protein